jgi:hypothetical protein
MSGIHYEIEEELENELENELEEDFIEVDPKLICKYSGLLSVYAYQFID